MREDSARILLVDDNDALALSYQMGLEAVGLEVVLAADSGMAQERLRQQQFDLLVSDCFLPTFEAPELIAKAKAVVPRLPVVCLTMDPTPEVRRRCRQAGADLVLTKPFEFSLLERVCRGNLQSAGVGPSPISAPTFRRLDEMVAELRSGPRVAPARVLKELAEQLGLERLGSAAGALEISLTGSWASVGDREELCEWLTRELERLWNQGLVESCRSGG